MFNEEWELLTEPMLNEPAPILTLSGMATQPDHFIEKRAQVEQAFVNEMDRRETEVQEDYLTAAHPMTPPARELTFVEQFN